jgi:hypothetical protein
MESPRLSNDRTETLRPDSPRLTEPSSSRIRRSASPSFYSLSHASTSSSPHLQLPRKTVLRRTSSSLSFQAISGLDDITDLGETYLDKSLYRESNHEHSNHDSHNEEGKQGHIHESESHDYGHSHDSNVKPLPTLSYIFSSLPPSQKTLFTWGTVHLFLGILLWLKGQWGCGLGKLYCIFSFQLINITLLLIYIYYSTYWVCLSCNIRCFGSVHNFCFIGYSNISIVKGNYHTESFWVFNFPSLNIFYLNQLFNFLLLF